MARRDTRKTNKFSLEIQNQSLDMMPHKSTKRAKVKERQEAKKIIRREKEDENS